MSKSLKFSGVTFLLALVLVGCFGPMTLSRQFDDWANEFYTKNAWLGQINIILYPLAWSLCSWVDFLALNFINFWFQNKDYNGDGTPFNHKNVAAPPNKKAKP
jgi:hypothetical protein